ncbi:MAG: putative rane protein [Pseudonocardiales bacterium]|nr:putative rane protein [Pseudonocardiales bacterium]
MLSELHNPTLRRADVAFVARVGSIFGFLTLLTAAGRLLIRSLWTPSGPIGRLDGVVLDHLHSFAISHPHYASAMRGISAVGAVMWWILLTPLCLVLVWKCRPRLAVMVAITALGSSLLNAVIKAIIGRTRPLLDDPTALAGGNLFPSGHTQAAIVGSSLLIVVGRAFLNRRLWLVITVMAIGVSVAIGFSRVALGVHYLSDVIGAAVVGLLWVAFMLAVYAAWKRDLAIPVEGRFP